ncbi:PEP-CTERM protein-sorting domain-containing protein [Nitrosospira multiformis]|uniref:PEP-CTERM protein-sorting domain-containing protein n=1 Tax=Nitrosospira multiformis TaxID=1231 RepID=A0A1H8BIX7_9PROT|nr:PEP-CTERM sorting domain-containing protein [Nitrosospira multiformis]SEM82861.1 PEP-CTERM protein-sorting domain-containing protein [Nitrosospira multiformis]
MNLLKTSFVAIAYSITAGLANSANASEGTAQLEWSQLQLSVTGMNGATPTLTFTDQITNLTSSVSIPGKAIRNDTASLPDWTSSEDTNVQVGSTFSNALASPSSLSGSVETNPEPVEPDHTHHPVEALASGSRSANFSLDGPGVLTISVPYSISIAGGRPFNFFDAISATVTGNSSFNNSVNNPVFFSLSSFEEGGSPGSQSGNLVFDIAATEAGMGTFELRFDLSSQAPAVPIPEPESYAMLLAGLGIVATLARRRTI